MSVEELQRQKAASRDKRKFLKVRPIEGGSWCIMEPCELEDMTGGEELQTYEVQDVWMTNDEWEALPEFQGW